MLGTGVHHGHAPRKRGIQYAVRLVNESRRRSLLDHPLARVMTFSSWERAQLLRRPSAVRFHCVTLSAIMRVDFIAAWLSWA
ncbi:hypothetical protein SAMN05444159_5342 [Bradyrhizobium lablabi]|uniref:Uncharacterized protein n=1 Tax=Bradyrhizobium lablabi TaxID=722472 RepID=A0A1M6YUQ0_9BRAD|nr:hypothetical protein SAMN05444159_5342 [Bradyrhizobium lablabi]